MWTWGELVGKVGFWIVVSVLIVLPLAWILDVSLQASDVTKDGQYRMLPDPARVEAYAQILVQDKRGIRTSLLYSCGVSFISTAIAMVVALSAVYLIIAEVLSPPWRRITVQGVVGLYFLPAFAVYPGIQAIARALPLLKSSLLQLVVAHSMLGFVIAFVLLLLAYTSVPHFHFEQLLLETRSRLVAFWRGVVRPQIVATIVVAAVTFASVWNEFFISNLITGTESVKPFSVILQMAQQQYGTDYSTFASGSILSLCISFLFIPFLVGIFLLISKLYWWFRRTIE